MSTLRTDTLQTTDSAVTVAIADIASRSELLNPSLGTTLINWIRNAVGAVSRTLFDKLSELVSVKDFGAVGNGVTNDSPAIQAALNYLGSRKGGRLYFPQGDYNLVTPIQMPAVNLKLYGDGRGSRLFSNASAVIVYPISVYDTNGKLVTQEVSNLHIDQTGDGIGIQLHQTWDGAAKVGPRIVDNYFTNSSATTVLAKSISLSGVWSAVISRNQLVGGGAGGGPTSGLGGFGIYFSIGADMNTSVMNLLVQDNTINTIAFPIYIPDRVGSGRVEGLKFSGNNMVAGNIGIRTSQCLASVISGNQMSDFSVGIYSKGDFDLSIIGNSEITGLVSGINIVATSTGLVERILVTGNNIGTGLNGVGIRITNTVGNDSLRSIALAYNTINGVNFNGTVGIVFEGAYRTNAMTINNNILSLIKTGIDFGSATHVNVNYGSNSFYGVTTMVIDSLGVALQASRVYGKTQDITLAGGTATPVINIPVPAGFFQEKPVYASLVGSVDLVTGYYDAASSTATSLTFTLRGAAGGVLSAGTRSVSVVANGISY